MRKVIVSIPFEREIPSKQQKQAIPNASAKIVSIPFEREIPSKHVSKNETSLRAWFQFPSSGKYLPNSLKFQFPSSGK